VAADVFEALGHDRSEIGRLSTADYFADKPGAAVRPLNSVLDLSKILVTGFRPRDWRVALSAYLAAGR
jgi:dTDP-4-dehydrorhamnose 3,5-epimerase